MCLRTDEARIERTSQGDVGCALNDGPAVGEQGNGVWTATETQQQVVAADILDVGMGGKAGAHGGEVDGTVMLMDLDGVAAAEGDVSAILASKVGEDALAADLAPWARGAGGDLGSVQISVPHQVPEVEGDQCASHEVRLAGEVLERLCDLEGGGEIDGRRQDAGS